MKTLIIWITIVAATIQSTSAQRNSESKTKYGFSISQFKSQSGFQTGYDFHFTIQPNTKIKAGIGLFFDNESKRISGLSLTHQRMLFTERRKLPVVQPCVFYNYIYRRTFIPELIETPEGISSSGDWATYASMEHHLGMGLNINVSKNIKLNCGLGYGFYLGSIKRPSTPDPVTRQISGTNGGGLIFKTGIGFQI